MLIEAEMHNGFPSSLGYITLIKYYPVRFQVSEVYQSNRQAVYDFKAGRQSQEMISYFKSIITTLTEIREGVTCVCPIPASTGEKTDVRFRAFCQELCSGTSVLNGHYFLRPLIDRAEIHRGGQRNYHRVLDCIWFSNNIQGKNIVLIDDVVTTGRSFRIIAQKLVELGATSVNGIMLAKTHWLQEDVADDRTQVNIADDLPF